MTTLRRGRATLSRFDAKILGIGFLVFSCFGKEKATDERSDSPQSAGAASDMENNMPGNAGNTVHTSEQWARPRQVRSNFRLEQGPMALEVDVNYGARLVEFSRGGHDVLTGADIVAQGDDNVQNLYGSTFWTSPQSDWGWPPEVPLDSGAYGAEVAGDALVLTSDPGPTTGYAVEKRIALSDEGAVLEYRLLGTGATRPAAPWEVTRVAKHGVVFYPHRGEPLAQSTLRGESRGGVVWLDLAALPARDGKLFQNGSEGWLAYAADGHVFIKRFENVADRALAPGESDVEIYVNGNFDYVEIEQQGPMATPSFASPVWRVYWQLLELPADVPSELGSEPLVRWVREQVKRASGDR
jgi:hypothetical protein